MPNCHCPALQVVSRWRRLYRRASHHRAKCGPENYTFQNAKKVRENLVSSVMIYEYTVVMNLYDRIFWLYVCNLSFFHLSVVEMRQLNMSNKWKLRVSFPKYLVPSKEWYVPALYKACFVRDEPSRVINLDGPFRCEAWPGYYLCLMCRCCCHMVHLAGGHYC